MNEQAINLQYGIIALKKRWIFIVLITIISTLISAVNTYYFKEPVYEATTKVFVGKQEIIQNKYNSDDILMYQKLLKTYSEIIKTENLATKALQHVATNLSAASVVSSLTVTPIEDTQIIEISLNGRNKQETKEVLESILNEFILTAKNLIPNGNIDIIEDVKLPTSPISPNKHKDILIGFLIGLISSMGLVLLLDYLNNTFRYKEELEEELDIPVIGVVPKRNTKKVGEICLE